MSVAVDLLAPTDADVQEIVDLFELDDEEDDNALLIDVEDADDDVEMAIRVAELQEQQEQQTQNGTERTTKKKKIPDDQHEFIRYGVFTEKFYDNFEKTSPYLLQKRDKGITEKNDICKTHLRQVQNNTTILDNFGLSIQITVHEEAREPYVTQNVQYDMNNVFQERTSGEVATTITSSTDTTGGHQERSSGDVAIMITSSTETSKRTRTVRSSKRSPNKKSNNTSTPTEATSSEERKGKKGKLEPDDEASLVVKTGKRTINGVEFLTPQAKNQTVNKTVQSVVDLFSYIGEHFLIIIITILSWDARAFELVMETCIKLGKSLYHRVRRVLANNYQDYVKDPRLWLATVLYWKDKILLSHKKYFDFTNKLYLVGYLPCKTKLVQFRKGVNEACTKAFNLVKLDSYAYMVDGTAIISYLKRLGGMGEQAYTVVKISFDGASKGFVHAVVGIINSKILANQSLEAIISILLYKGKEGIDLLEKYLNPALEKICDLPRELYKLAMVNDLKATALISDLYEDDCFCPFCTCKKNQ